MLIRGGWVLAGTACLVLSGESVGAATSLNEDLHAHVVHIYRDRYGMAHLYAEREEEGFYGLGYAIGEDRLLQVLTWYVAARGELAATFGPTTPPPPADRSPYEKDAKDSPLYDAVASDIGTRKYMLLPKARRNLLRLPLQLQKDLRAYVDGLSAYMRDHRARTPSWAPPLEPALPLALYHLQANEQTGVCDERRAADRTSAPPAAAVPAAAQTSPLPFGASNAWAVAGSRTGDGRVVMASDSHGGIGTAYGTTFYPYRIKAGDIDIVAFDRPGTVYFPFGHSRFFAWGLTEAPRFVADCYRIRVNPKSPRTFVFDGVTKRMITVPYQIRVKNAAAITGTFEYTKHNGVLSPVVGREGDLAYAVSYAYAERIGMGTGEGYKIATARTKVQLVEALEQRDFYPANLVVGGADGTIMYIRPGRIPIRPPGLDVRHTLDGNTSATAWRGIHPYADLIKLIDPPQGYVSNSNVSPDQMYPTPTIRAVDYPEYFAFGPRMSWSRQERIVELLGHAEGLSVDGAKAILMDETIAATRSWGPVFARVLLERPDLFVGRSPDLRPFLDELARFDGVFSKESRGAAYHDVLRRMLFTHHHDDMDALQDAVENGQLNATQQQLLVKAAAEAYDTILSTYGRLELTWGDIHRIGRGEVDLPIGGGRVMLGTRAGRMGGYGTSSNTPWPVRISASVRSLAFQVEAGSVIERLIEGQRIPFLVHFAPEGVQSYAQELWGVSDDPSSPHYADQSRLASDKILRAIPMTVDALTQEHAVESVLVRKSVASAGHDSGQ